MLLVFLMRRIALASIVDCNTGGSSSVRVVYVLNMLEGVQTWIVKGLWGCVRCDCLGDKDT